MHIEHGEHPNRHPLLLTLVTTLILAGCGSTDPSPPPTANIFASATNVEVGVSVDFDGSASEAGSGEIASWAWDFGDEATAEGNPVSHSYASPGTFTVSLEVTDDGGGSAVDSTDITVTPPAVTISSMVQSSRTADSFSLSWTTDTASDCTVEYGPYRFYGAQTAGSGDAGKLLHTLTLTGLRTHTSYDIQVAAEPVSRDYATGMGAGWEFGTLTYSRGTNVTTGWDAIGALCFADAEEYYGPICTGVLIADDWVLTAAHCLDVDASYYGRVPGTSNTVFYIGGNDADHGSDGADPATGDLYAIDQIVIHPDYAGGAENDLALVHLASPVSGIAPVPYNTSTMAGSEGSTIYTAGFDASYTGLKKEAARSISTIYMTSFVAASDYGLGASGIVAASESADPQVLGIAVAVATGTDDPFLGEAVFTRIDAYSAWIAGVVGG